jgi:hypothetical protein
MIGSAFVKEIARSRIQQFINRSDVVALIFGPCRVVELVSV